MLLQITRTVDRFQRVLKISHDLVTDYLNHNTIMFFYQSRSGIEAFNNTFVCNPVA